MQRITASLGSMPSKQIGQSCASGGSPDGGWGCVEEEELPGEDREKNFAREVLFSRNLVQNLTTAKILEGGIELEQDDIHDMSAVG